MNEKRKEQFGKWPLAGGHEIGLTYLTNLGH